MPTAHLQRSKKYLEQFGLVDKAEHYVAIPGRKFGVTKDLFGIFDLIFVSPNGIVGVQVTSSGAVTAHKQKIESAVVTKKWLAAGGSIVLHLWKKNKSKRWTLKIMDIYMAYTDELVWRDTGYKLPNMQEEQPMTQ
jgi:hypothetical protein